MELKLNIQVDFFFFFKFHLFYLVLWSCILIGKTIEIKISLKTNYLFFSKKMKGVLKLHLQGR